MKKKQIVTTSNNHQVIKFIISNNPLDKKRYTKLGAGHNQSHKIWNEATRDQTTTSIDSQEDHQKA